VTGGKGEEKGGINKWEEIGSQFTHLHAVLFQFAAAAVAGGLGYRLESWLHRLGGLREVPRQQSI
jgi:hypothetical protein